MTLAPGYYCYAWTTNASSPSLKLGSDNNPNSWMPFSFSTLVSGTTSGGSLGTVSSITAPSTSYGQVQTIWGAIY